MYTGKLNKEHIISLLETLAKQGHVEWQDPTKKGCLIMWRTPEEWGKLIYDWVSCFCKVVYFTKHTFEIGLMMDSKLVRRHENIWRLF